MLSEIIMDEHTTRNLSKRKGSTVCRSLLMIPVLAASPVLAQTSLEQIEPRLARALEEHRVFLTCSSLDADMHALVQANWRDIVGKARAALSGSASEAQLKAFDERTAPSALIATNASLADTIVLCTQTHKDWAKQLAQFRFVLAIDGAPLPFREKVVSDEIRR